jgi:transitional endoplasmic reticulum ATPase
MQWLVESTSRFTPADIEYLFQQVAQFAFEQELAGHKDYKVVTATLQGILPHIQPTLTDEIVATFEKERAKYARV